MLRFERLVLLGYHMHVSKDVTAPQTQVIVWCVRQCYNAKTEETSLTQAHFLVTSMI